MGLFFFAGQGVQYGGENYLIPSNTSIASEAFLRSRAVAMQAVMDTLNASGNSLNMVLLDACRDNPFGWARSGSRGHTVVGQPPPGSIIVYATSAGSTAADGGGRNGVFTGELLKHRETPGVDVKDVFNRTGASVSQVSGGRQIPAIYSQFFGAASFRTGAAPAAVPAPAATSFGTVTLAPGSLSVTVTSAATVSLLGQSVELPAGATLPVNNVAAGEVALAVRYADGKTENRSVRVEANRSASVSFDYKPASAAAPPQATPGSLPRTLSSGQSWTSPVGIKFMAVPAGSFQMGSPSGGDDDERPVRQVSLTGFWLGATEVTQGQWQAVMGSNPSHTSYGIGSNNPVNQVSWYDILEFCNRLSIKEGLTPVYSISGSTDPDRWGVVPTSGNSTWNAVSPNWQAAGYRLPTEAEWEYAAKGGEQGSRQNVAYAGSNNAADVAWYDANSDGKNQPVGLKKANPLGLFDMSGNVWEWVWDWDWEWVWDWEWKASYPSSSQADPTGPASGSYRVIRWGCWVEAAWGLLSDHHFAFIPDIRIEIVGLRLARPPVR